MRRGLTLRPALHHKRSDQKKCQEPQEQQTHICLFKNLAPRGPFRVSLPDVAYAAATRWLFRRVKPLSQLTGGRLIKTSFPRTLLCFGRD